MGMSDEVTIAVVPSGDVVEVAESTSDEAGDATVLQGAQASQASAVVEATTDMAEVAMAALTSENAELRQENAQLRQRAEQAAAVSAAAAAEQSSSITAHQAEVRAARVEGTLACVRDHDVDPEGATSGMSERGVTEDVVEVADASSPPSRSATSSAQSSAPAKAAPAKAAPARKGSRRMFRRSS